MHNIGLIFKDRFFEPEIPVVVPVPIQFVAHNFGSASSWSEDESLFEDCDEYSSSKLGTMLKNWERFFFF